LSKDLHLISIAAITVTSSLTAIALIVSSIIQAKKYELTVYHGIIIVNLTLLLALNTLPPFGVLFIRVAQKSYWIRKDRVDAPVVFQLIVLILLSIISFFLIGGFGLWVFRNTNSFDRLSDKCATSTVFWFFGKYRTIMNPSFRKFWLVMLCASMVPGGMAGLMFIFSLPLVILVISWTQSTQLFHHEITLTDTINITTMRWLQYGMGGTILIASALLVTTVEKTIRSNTVTAGENQWTLGQSLALIIALYPIVQLFFVFSPMRKGVQRYVFRSIRDFWLSRVQPLGGRLYWRRTRTRLAGEEAKAAEAAEEVEEAEGNEGSRRRSRSISD
jgi:hypothetical protein